MPSTASAPTPTPCPAPQPSSSLPQINPTSCSPATNCPPDLIPTYLGLVLPLAEPRWVGDFCSDLVLVS